MSRFTIAARSLNTAATLLGGPGSASNSTSSVNGSASFHFVLDDDIQTLSAQNAPKDGPIRGLLFVPSLNSHDPCNNITAPFMPTNVTRHQDVTPFGYQTIGLAPWITPNCSRSFLDSSRRVGTEALVFFLPASDDTKPPPPADSTWLLSGESSWETEYPYPVYAIPGPAGNTLMEQLSRYSGNETLYRGQENASVTSSQDERGDVRLFTLIDLEKTGKKTSSIWGFLLAILGTILVLCIIVLLLYQLIQRRRRESLQRRIEAGEADYQQLDLQHFKVPREFLSRLPIYVYPSLDDVGRECSVRSLYDNDKPDRTKDMKETDFDQTETEKVSEVAADADITNYSSAIRVEEAQGAEQNPKTANARIEDISRRPALQEPFPPATVDSGTPYPQNAYRLSHSQTTCAICLDDFVPTSSSVRELPCGHIYHPECIDVSLTRISSLCPLCKKSVLAPEFYPISAPEAVYQQDDMRAS
ncbi:hypothetical protein BJX76DRAFT_184635 [Aspergillus varians]